MTTAKVNHPVVVKAARNLRIKIHSFEKGTGCQGADNPDNSKWLDQVTVDDAAIIERLTHYSRLVKAATDYLEAGLLSDSFNKKERQLRSVLAEIKDLGSVKD